MEIINIVSMRTKIPTTMMRITFGKREIRPTKELLKWHWKDNDQIEIKLKIIGGGSMKPMKHKYGNDYTIKQPKYWIKKNRKSWKIKEEDLNEYLNRFGEY